MQALDLNPVPPAQSKRSFGSFAWKSLKFHRKCFHSSSVFLQLFAIFPVCFRKVEKSSRVWPQSSKNTPKWIPRAPKWTPIVSKLSPNVLSSMKNLQNDPARVAKWSPKCATMESQGPPKARKSQKGFQKC